VSFSPFFLFGFGVIGLICGIFSCSCIGSLQ
jgi:hypothetical protein